MADCEATTTDPGKRNTCAPASEEESVKGVPPGGVIVQLHDKMSVVASVPITPSVVIVPDNVAPC
jgi:hypothetical protein